MAKAKTTDIRYEVSGYAKHDYMDAPVVRVVVSGTYEGHNLKGVCLVNDGTSTWREPVETRGDGRYSFMIGNSSLYKSDPAAKIIIKAAQGIAKDWQALHPAALHEYHVAQAVLRLVRATAAEKVAVKTLNSATEERESAQLSLAAIKKLS